MELSGVHMTLEQVRNLAITKLQAVGLAPDHAAAVAATLVAGERDGCGAHGLYRLLVAAHSVQTGVAIPDAVPVVSEPAKALVKVDGRGGFAQLAFERGLPLLEQKARDHGIAAMALVNMVHFAALWPEVEALAERGLVALAVTANHAWVAPEGGTAPIFGTNPIAFAWPRIDAAGAPRPPFVFDFATSVVARGEIELHRRAGRPIPDHWGIGGDGQPSTDARAVLDEGAMRTFGGHKGSALAAMVELLSAPLIGDLSSAESIALDGGRKGSPIGGELIIAIDPAGFLGDALHAHLARAEAIFTAMEAAGARLPGSRRHAARARSLKEGVTIAQPLYDDILKIGMASDGAA